MNLYHITCDTDDGDNLDLFVWAGGAGLARLLWYQHYDLDDDDYDPVIRLIPITPPDTPRVIDWSSITPI